MSRSIYSEWQYWITGRSTCVSNNYQRIQYLSKDGTNKKYIVLRNENNFEMSQYYA